MNKQRIHKIVFLFIASTLLQMNGCAGTDTANNDQRQGASSMGHKSRGGKQGPPSTMARNDRSSEEDNNVNKTPPAEAISACVEKKLGDHVEFTGPRGETVIAVCQIYDDHLVAVPEEMMSEKSKRL
ncbi:MAG: hypothetical protein ACN4GW_13105 [Desulforhopalus sp.]